MPVLAHTKCFDPETIKRSFFPFSRPDYIEGMVIGDDLDSLLSAMYLQNKYEWPVKGVYTQYTNLYGAEKPAIFKEKLLTGRYIAVDLDINHAAIPCIGHHIISLDSKDTLVNHTHTLNPNAIRDFSVRDQFTRKYPLSTIQFLMAIFQENNLSDKTRMAIWLADSTYINAQQYTPNVRDWVETCFPLFLSDLDWVQTIEFERILQNLVMDSLSENPLCKLSRSNYKSKYLGLNGYQCQFQDPVLQQLDLHHLLIKLSRITGWSPLAFPRHFPTLWSGKRRDESTKNIPELDTWLAERNVFSYAFTYKNTVNYTCDLI